MIDEVRVAAGENVLIVGAAGSVGLIAAQLAVSRGAQVFAAVRPSEFEIAEAIGATPVAYGPDLAATVRVHVPGVDAVIDAAGAGTLGARWTSPVAPHGSSRCPIRMLLTSGAVLRSRRPAHCGASRISDGRIGCRSAAAAIAADWVPLAAAASAHRRLESGELRAKVLFDTRDWRHACVTTRPGPARPERPAAYACSDTRRRRTDAANRWRSRSPSVPRDRLADVAG